VSRTDGTSSDGDLAGDLFAGSRRRRPLPPQPPQPQPPLTPYAEDELTAPLVPIFDESPTTVIPIIPRGVAELSPEQDDLLERLRSRTGDRPPRSSRRPRPGRPDRGSRRSRSVLWRSVITALVFSMVLVLSAAGIASALYAKYNGQLHRVAVLQTHDPNIRDAARQQNAQNFLVIGSDSRAGLGSSYGNESGARSDTTMIVHLSPSHTQATIISIPRDSWVTIPDCKASDGSTIAAHQNMFNSAFSIGGPACTIATVQKLTGIAVTHFVAIDFAGFQSMVDALGTVSICSPENVNDPGSGLHLHTGTNSLNGKQALAYVRARETLGDGSDLGRIKRQQMFMGAVLRQAMHGPVLTNPARLTAFLDAATKAITIDTGTTFGDLRTLASSLQGLDTKHVTFYTAPIANPDYTPPGTSMTGRVLLDTTQGRALYDSVIEDRTPVWVKDVNGQTKIVASANGQPTTTAPSGTPTSSAKPSTVAPTTNPELPKANLNAAQQTCSL
jgi:LCP family protein required for cell wall assembly